MTTKEFVEKYKKVYESLINDPYTEQTDTKTREQVASEEAQQRVKQSINNEKALSMAAELSSVEKFTTFMEKEDINLDDIIYGTPSRSHLKTMKKPVALFDIEAKRINVKEPPSNSSKETKKELRALQDQTKNVDEKLKERINREDKNFELTFYEYLDKNDLDYDKDFIQAIITEARVYVQHFKYRFNRPRPRQLGELVGIPVIQQKGGSSNTPAYPSGHAIQSRLVALFLGREHPEHREELLKIAEEIGINRIKGGFHYTSDHEAGRLVANDLWASLLKKVRRMKKSFGSDPISDLIKDYMEQRKEKWSNITKIGNFVTEQSLEKAKDKEASFEYQQLHRNETDANQKVEGVSKRKEAPKPKQPKAKTLSFEETSKKYEKHIVDQEESHKKNVEDIKTRIKTNEVDYKKAAETHDKARKQKQDDLAKKQLVHAKKKGEVNEEFKAFKDKYDPIVKEIEDGLVSVNQQISDVQTKIDKKSTKALQTKLEELDQERDELEFERDTESEGGIAWYKTTQAGYKKDIRDLNNQLKEAEEDFKNYPTSTQYVTDLKNKNEEVLKKLNSELDQMQKDHKKSIANQKKVLKEAKKNKTFSTEEQEKINDLSEQRENIDTKVDESVEDALEGEHLEDLEEESEKDFEDISTPDEFEEDIENKQEDTEADKDAIADLAGETQDKIQETQEDSSISTTAETPKEKEKNKNLQTKIQEDVIQALEEEDPKEVEAKLAEVERKNKRTYAKPTVEEAEIEEAKPEEAVEEEPKAEEEPTPEPETPTEEPVAEEKPKVEEPKAQEPKVEEPKAEKPKAEEPKPTPEKQPKTSSENQKTKVMEALFGEDIDSEEAQTYSDHLDDNPNELKSAYKKHVISRIENIQTQKLKDAEKTKTESEKTDAIKQEQEAKAEEEKIKQRTEQESNLSERAKALGYKDSALETIFKDNEDLSNFEQQVQNEESVVKDKLYGQIDNNILPQLPYNFGKEPDSWRAAFAELPPQKVKDLSNKLKNYFEDKLKAPQAKALEAAYSNHVKSVYDSLKYIDPKNPTLFDKTLRDKLQERSNAYKVVAKSALDEKGNSYLSAEKQTQIHKEFQEAMQKAKNEKELKEAFETIDEAKHEGIGKPTAEDKFEVSEDDKRAERRKKRRERRAARKKREQVEAIKTRLKDSEERTSKRQKDYMEQQEEIAEVLGVDPMDVDITPEGDVRVRSGSGAKIQAKTKEIAEKLGIKQENIQTTPEGEGGFDVKITPEEKIDIADAKLRAENMKAGTFQVGADGLQQIYVPGRGKGWINIQRKEKGELRPDIEAKMKADADIQAWRKANDQKAPTELAGGRIRVGGEVKIDGKDPTKKPKEDSDKPSLSIGARRGTGAQSALDAFSSKVGGSKKGTESKLDAFLDNIRRG
jgi:hypothetical protein